MRYKVFSAGLLTAAMLLTACGGSASFSASTDTIYVDKKGAIKGAYVADFDKEYYSADELTDYINDTVSEYTASKGDGTVTVADVGVENQVAHVYLDYADASDYAGFNGVELYTGKVLEAVAQGYNIPSDLVQIADKAKDVLDDSYKAVVIGQQVTVRVDGSIIYATPNAKVVGNEAEITYDMYAEDAEPAWVIYK